MVMIMKKIKEYIKEFFKENYKGLIILLIIFVIANYKLDISIYTPGGMIDLSERIKSDDKLYESSGSINMTYVTLVRGTIPTYVIAKILPTWEIVPNSDITYNENGDMEETINIDKYYMEEGISNAKKIAFDAAKIDYKIKKSNNIVTFIAENAETDLELFDNILKYDNIEFSTFIAMQEYISSKKVGDKVTFLVERDGKEIKREAKLIDIEGSAKVGISAAVINEYESNPSIKLDTKASESGSSGGLMMTLAIYNAITEFDITKGLVIAGTGTIDEEGNVGSIGGVTYKLAGADKRGADIFLVPSDNYEEALKYKKEHNFDIELVSISNFKEAINYLKNKEV